jgi:nitroreductase
MVHGAGNPLFLWYVSTDIFYQRECKPITMNVVTTVIKSRHSVRKFKPDRIDDNVIIDAIECARHAPTAMNLQPWLFGIIKDKQMLQKIAQLTDHGKFIADASLCIAVFGEKKATYYLEDCCAATENLIIALQAHGVSSCWVAGDKKGYAEQVRTLLNVPGGYTLVSLVPAGMPADISVVKKKDKKFVFFEESFKRDAS